MPAEGGYARSIARRNRQRGGRARATGAGYGGGRQINQGGFNVTTATNLRQRAHVPGGGGDPRMAAGTQQWGAATRGTRGHNYESGFQSGGRWWESGDVALQGGTQIAQTQSYGPGHNMVDTDPGNWTDPWVGENYYKQQQARWGAGGGSNAFTFSDIELF